jgi:hypothetical protein
VPTTDASVLRTTKALVTANRTAGAPSKIRGSDRRLDTPEIGALVKEGQEGKEEHEAITPSATLQR